MGLRDMLRAIREYPVAQRELRQTRQALERSEQTSILKESGTTRGTSERPSIEARLQGYRVQMRRSSAPARSKTKTQAKQR